MTELHIKSRWVDYHSHSAGTEALSSRLVKFNSKAKTEHIDPLASDVFIEVGFTPLVIDKKTTMEGIDGSFVVRHNEVYDSFDTLDKAKKRAEEFMGVVGIIK